MSGGVCLAKEIGSQAEVAVKILSTAHLTSKQREQTLLEVHNQLTMDHPGICRLLEVYEEPERLVLIMERLKGPDLFDHMHQKGKFSERDAAGYVRQIAHALKYCHGMGVCHRDLKLDNFCLTDPDSPEACIKMIDFGLSADMSAPMSDAVGTLYYVAPEVVRRGQYDESCDMWSLGVLTYVMLCGRPPFEGMDDRSTIAKICSGQYSFPRARFSRESESFIAGLLQVSPKKRLKIDEVIGHPWLAKADPVHDAVDETVAVDPEVLKALRTFMRSNALKRAVLCAVAPIAINCFSDVHKWEEDFKSLDTEGRGRISVESLTELLQSKLSTSPEEAANLASCLADADCKTHEVSYSAFLAACLSAQVTQAPRQDHEAHHMDRLREIFERMDKDGDGFITIEEIKDAFGDAVDLDEVRADLHGDGDGECKASFDYFRWLMISPTRGLGPILQSLNGRIETIRAKGVPGLTGSEKLEAARRENAAWRMWYMEHESGECSNKHFVESDVPDHRVISTDSALSASNISEAPPQALSKETAIVMGEAGSDLPTAWSIATAEAKDGDIEAIRRENMAWRKWNKEELEAGHEGNGIRRSLKE